MRQSITSVNPFDENIAITVAKLPVEIYNQIVELSPDKTLQLQFSSQDLKTCLGSLDKMNTEA